VKTKKLKNTRHLRRYLYESSAGEFPVKIACFLEVFSFTLATPKICISAGVIAM